jgi:hypothetical protein
MISEIRTFLKARIAEVDSSFKEHKDGFNNANIPGTNFNRAYHIIYTAPDNIVTDGCLLDDNINAEVRLYFRGFRDPQQAIDNGMDTAWELKQKASHPSLMPLTNIKKVSVVSITPDPVDTNDNSIIVTLDFRFRVIYSTTE